MMGNETLKQEYKNAFEEKVSVSSSSAIFQNKEVNLLFVKPHVWHIT